MNSDIKQELKRMYYDLIENKLHVILISAPESTHIGHKIRVADCNNPGWYRELCSYYPSKAKSHKNRFKSDTKIKRQAVLQFLEQPNKHLNFKYKDDLINIAKQRLQQYCSFQFNNQNFYLGDDITLRNYFNWFENKNYNNLKGKIYYIGKTGFTLIDQQGSSLVFHFS